MKSTDFVIGAFFYEKLKTILIIKLKLKSLRAINFFFILFTVLIVAFFSLFWIGSYEQKMELQNQLPFSFVFRFLGLSTIGLIGIGLLLFLNLIVEKSVSKKVDYNALKKLAIQGISITTLVALIGAILFFL